jgi:hypothetical protein
MLMFERYFRIRTHDGSGFQTGVSLKSPISLFLFPEHQGSEELLPLSEQAVLFSGGEENIFRIASGCGQVRVTTVVQGSISSAASRLE